MILMLIMVTANLCVHVTSSENLSRICQIVWKHFGKNEPLKDCPCHFWIKKEWALISFYAK